MSYHKKLTLCAKHRAATYTKPDRTVPSLAMSGNWLQRAGFDVGDRVTVTATDAGLFIARDSVQPYNKEA